MSVISVSRKGPILFLSAHLPSRDVPEAGQKIAFDHLYKLAKNNETHLVTFANELERHHYIDGSLDCCASATIVSVSFTKRILGVCVHPFLPIKISSRYNFRFVKLIRSLVKTIMFESAHLEYTAMGQYLPLIHSIPIKRIVEHDVCYQLFERQALAATGLKRWLLSVEAQRMKQWELRALREFDHVITLNPKDRQLLVRDGLPDQRVVVQPPEIDERFRRVRRDRYQAGALLLWGAFGRKENADAARWFLDDIFPSILRHCPDCVAYLVGANPPADLLARAGAHVKVTGFVESPIPYFEKAQVSVAPLRLGAGVKLKVLEALAARIPVVATEVGAEGIDDPLLVVANTPDAFARDVLRLIGSQPGKDDGRSHTQ